MAYVAILDSTLEKLTEDEKLNLQASLDSYYAEGYNRGYNDGYDEGFFDGEDDGYAIRVGPDTVGA